MDKKWNARVKGRMFMTGTQVKASFIIEFFVNRKWSILTDDNGIVKFDSYDAADTHRRGLIKKLEGENNG